MPARKSFTPRPPPAGARASAGCTPSSASTSAVCSPSRGAGPRTATAVASGSARGRCVANASGEAKGAATRMLDVDEELAGRELVGGDDLARRVRGRQHQVARARRLEELGHGLGQEERAELARQRVDLVLRQEVVVVGLPVHGAELLGRHAVLRHVGDHGDEAGDARGAAAQRERHPAVLARPDLALHARRLPEERAGALAAVAGHLRHRRGRHVRHQHGFLQRDVDVLSLAGALARQQRERDAGGRLDGCRGSTTPASSSAAARDRDRRCSTGCRWWRGP